MTQEAAGYAVWRRVELGVMEVVEAEGPLALLARRWHVFGWDVAAEAELCVCSGCRWPVAGAAVAALLSVDGLCWLDEHLRGCSPPVGANQDTE